MKKNTTTISDHQKVLDALYELLHNPQTPSDLWQACSEFVTDQSNNCTQELYQTTSYLTEVLKSVQPDELMGAVRARQIEEANTEVSHATN